MVASLEKSHYASRLLIAQFLACACLLILIVRLWFLQVVYGSYYRDRSENNRVRYIRTEAPRGMIFDRYGRILVRNRSAFNVALILEDTPDIATTVKRLAEITGRDKEKLLSQFKSSKERVPFEPKIVIYDISREELAKVKVNQDQLPGVIVAEAPFRIYPNKNLASQVFGYTRELNKFQLEDLKDKGYVSGDLIGQAGLEKEYEQYLRGDAGYIQVEVDARGNRRQELGIKDAQSGSDLELSIDLDLQAAAETALSAYRGAVVALVPDTGEVLVLASSPSFDANMFSGQVSASDWELLAKDKNTPLSNRAISAAYPPGSTSKILWSIAALAEDKINSKQELSCSGTINIANHTYHCHKKGGHGAVNMEKAIMVSCNSYYYQIGQRLGIDLMSKYLNLFGFGKPTGIDLSGEIPATAPSVEWKKRTYHQPWFAGDTVPVSIGQGYFVATPIQMAQLAAALANGGKVYRPKLAKKIIDSKTGQTKELRPELVTDIFRDRNPEQVKTWFEEIKSYAVEVVNNPRGTGRKAKLEGIIVGGKTGTAQVTALGGEGRGEKFKDHAWFISFAPAERPTIAMSVIIENSGHGGQFAAPIARTVLETYFRKLGMLEEQEEAVGGPAKVEEHAIEVEETTSSQAEEEDEWID